MIGMVASNKRDHQGRVYIISYLVFEVYVSWQGFLLHPPKQDSRDQIFELQTACKKTESKIVNLLLER